MVNWNDPQNIVLQTLADVKVMHFVGGVFIWEFLSTLYFEWGVYTGKRPANIPVFVYIVCRWTTLGAVLCELVSYNLTGEYNCNALAKILLAFSYGGLCTASILIVLRGIALWERKLIPSGILILVWLVNLGWMISGIVTFSAVWNPLSKVCGSPNTDDSRNTIIVTFVTDFVLLVIYIAGTVRHKNAGGMWRLIFKQGIIWVAMATLSELPAALFLILNLNAPMDIMFQSPALITMTICATRMFRDLAEFGRCPVGSDYFGKGKNSVSKLHFRANEDTVSLPMTRLDTFRLDPTITDATSRRDDSDVSGAAEIDNGKFELTRPV